MKYTSEEIGLPHCSLTDAADAVAPFLANYFLVCSAESIELNQGTWSFSLDSVDGQTSLEASDSEVGDLNRLTLLAAVRGLEAIDGSSDVTLLSQNRYLIRSLTDSLPRWRANQFAWEHFGRRIDVQNADLWRRIDHALSIHRVEACLVSSRLVSRQAVGVPGAKDSRFNLDLDSAESSHPSPNETRSAVGNNMGGIQWRVDGAHSAVPKPALASRGKRSERLRRNRFRDLVGGGESHSSVSNPALESA